MKLSAERSLRLAKASAEASALEEERTKLERQSALELARSNARLIEKNNKIRELEAEAKQLQLEASNTVTRLTNEINRFQKEDEARKIAANVKPKYLKDPYVDGVLRNMLALTTCLQIRHRSASWRCVCAVASTLSLPPMS